jgi:hypothetical protein
VIPTAPTTPPADYSSYYSTPGSAPGKGTNGTSGWYYNSRTGHTEQDSGIYGFIVGNTVLHAGEGWHGPFPTEQDMMLWIKANQVSGWVLPANAGGFLAQLKHQAVGTAGAAAKAAANFTWKGVVSGFSGTNFVLRAIKVIIGGTLLLVGIVHMAGIDSGKIAAIASKVPIPV